MTADRDDTSIADYAVVGDCHGSALVSRLGSADWCCLERFDADPVCCRLLDRDRGGFLELRPAGPFEASRSYLGDTNVLRTTFRASDGSGEVAVMDFMLVGRRAGSGVNDCVTLDAPHALVRVIGPRRDYLAALADIVAERWAEPDDGFWELRDGPRHHVQGRMMSWVALDRAAKLFGDRPRWARAREVIVADILARGVDPAGGHLRFAQDLDGVDSFMALLPLYATPVPREVQERTLGAIRRRLDAGRGLLRRYDVDDGLEGREGPFLACGFRVAEGLLLLGRPAEAREAFEAALAPRNDVGLLAEEADPSTGELLGNFPQALSHLALVMGALALRAFERGGEAALAGPHADRVRRSVGSVFGARGVWEALVRSGQPPRLVSSRRSLMPGRFAAPPPA